MKQKQSKNKKIYYLDFGKKKAEIKTQDGKYKTIEQQINELKPDLPVYCVRPNSIKRAAKWFLDNFNHYRHETRILYSVKSNSDISTLNYLYETGLRHFDVASLVEVKDVFNTFGDKVTMYFMHPIKSRQAIKQSYFEYGVRDFVLDSFDELKKIQEETNNAKDLNLHVRLAIPNSHSIIDLSRKFGILPSSSKALLRKTRTVAKKMGVSFHVGSQCMDPIEFRNAINIVKESIDKAKVKIDVLDVGGGFPSSYPGMMPPDLKSYMNEIFDVIDKINLDKDCQIWCEPGRAMVAESTSLVVRVESRKKNMLYINDGTYGGLFDAGHPGFLYHAKVLRVNSKKSLSKKEEPFGFFGPTCDSLDVMKGPFYLPKNIGEGDYIEIGQLGSYSKSFRTEFNGFKDCLQIEVMDEPLVSMYDTEEESQLIISNK